MHVLPLAENPDSIHSGKDFGTDKVPRSSFRMEGADLA